MTRRPEIQNNALLPSLFESRVGERIYLGLKDGFRDVQFGAPAATTRAAGFDAAFQNCRQLLDIFVEKGYCIKAELSNPTTIPSSSSATPGGVGYSFTVNVQGPASLWSLQGLASKRSSILNAYDALVMAAYLRASGWSPSCELGWDGSIVTEKWTVV